MFEEVVQIDPIDLTVGEEGSTLEEELVRTDPGIVPRIHGSHCVARRIYPTVIAPFRWTIVRVRFETTYQARCDQTADRCDYQLTPHAETIAVPFIRNNSVHIRVIL